MFRILDWLIIEKILLIITGDECFYTFIIPCPWLDRETGNYLIVAVVEGLCRRPDEMPDGLLRYLMIVMINDSERTGFYLSLAGNRISYRSLPWLMSPSLGCACKANSCKFLDGQRSPIHVLPTLDVAGWNRWSQRAKWVWLPILYWSVWPPHS